MRGAMFRCARCFGTYYVENGSPEQARFDMNRCPTCDRVRDTFPSVREAEAARSKL